MKSTALGRPRTDRSDSPALSREDQPLGVTDAVDLVHAALALTQASVAYVSDDSDQDEIYVQPYPGPGAKVAVSTDGGTEPVWSADGRQLFYRRGTQMIAVDVVTEPTFTAGQTRALFESARYVSDQGGALANPEYDVFPDASALVMIEASTPLPRLHVIFNWLEELELLVPTD